MHPAPTFDTGRTQDRRLQIDLEEYRQLVEERRFVMQRYIQSLFIYLAVMGYSIKELLFIAPDPIFITLTALLICAIAFAYYAARQFRSMAYHAIDREKLLAMKLQVQPPHEMLWGYYGGIFLLLSGLIAVLALIVHRFIRPIQLWLALK